MLVTIQRCMEYLHQMIRLATRWEARVNSYEKGIGVVRIRSRPVSASTMPLRANKKFALEWDNCIRFRLQVVLATRTRGRGIYSFAIL